MRNAGPKGLQSIARFLFPRIAYILETEAAPELIVARLTKATLPEFIGVGSIKPDVILTSCKAQRIRIRYGAIGAELPPAFWRARLLRTSMKTVIKVSVHGRGRLYFLGVIGLFILGLLLFDYWAESLGMAVLLVAGILSEAFTLPGRLEDLDSTVMAWMKASLQPFEVKKWSGTSHNSM